MNSGAQDMTTDDQNKVIRTKDEKNEATTDKKKERIESKNEREGKVAEVRKSERIRKQ